MQSILLVSGAGFLAGAMNALAGGGSFVSLPAMIAAGLPPVQANASSTVALFPGGVVSAWAYRDGLGPVGSVSIRRMLVVTLIGGFVGAALLLSTSSKTFSFVLPWLLLCASITLAFGRTLGETLRRRWHISAPAVLSIQFVLGVYGGYFGGAVGIMMMAVWGLLDARDLKSLNAPRTLLVSAANSVAVLTFAAAQAVRWPETLAMLLAAMLGGYGGAQLGRRAPAQLIRAGTLLVSAGITIAFFVKTYAPMLFHR
ncbi:sulfite exporter TauE/SafE family protein [Caballeronia sp. LZ035]|uniref:sulfite exporter TauE/SafE family protein n=1 Tax=Caballeronia sp. LZ035 TaxID=3038568 RepID=UPI002866B647|nr:sulfite exporter TauE/SafE family protein [Caballeronia sp. LZ035]MDR5760315.1 sulfite exporter TauE/SafE family protein [Caballeronia sp. LZ035]